MAGQFKCRFCSKSFKDVLGFLDHFETHVNQDSPKNKENVQQNSSDSKIEEFGNNGSYHLLVNRRSDDHFY